MGDRKYGKDSAHFMDIVKRTWRSIRYHGLYARYRGYIDLQAVDEMKSTQ